MPPLGNDFAAGFSGGGAGLGNAQGAITLDVSDLINAERISKTVGRNIEQNLSGIGRATGDVQTGFRGLGSEADNVTRRIGGMATAVKQSLLGVSRTIQSLRSEIATIGLFGGLTTAFGLKAANDIRTTRIRLSQFVETEEEANQLMNSLADGASEFGLKLEDVFSLAGTLLPILEGNVEATGEWVKRAALLRTVLPSAQQGAEIRAISEYLAGQTISLQRLFNIPPNIILEAKAQFQDAGEQLDYILQRMGATEEAARDMADPLVSVKNELKLIASVGFGPILQRIRDILPGFREWLSDIRQAHPEILEIGAAFLAAAAVGAPMLLFLGQVLSTLEKIKALGLVGSLGRAGLLGLAVGGAAVGVTAGAQAIGRASDDPRTRERLQDISFVELMRDGLKALADLFFIFVARMAPVIQTIIDALARFAQVVINIYGSLGQVLSRIGDLLPNELGGDRLRRAGNVLEQAAKDAEEFANQVRENNRNTTAVVLASIAEDRASLSDFLNSIFSSAGTSTGTSTPGGAIGTGAGTGGLNELQQAQAEAWMEYQEQIAAIEEQGQARRLEITEQYEEQRSRIIANYEKLIAQEAADFARQRARDIKSLNDEIDGIRGEAMSREAEWWRELQVTIEELRQESAARIAEIEAAANRQREQMERQHRDNLLSAASRLDARAVAEENRRFKTQSQNFEENLADRLRKERENLDERIQQEQKGHQERIAQQRQEDEKRIADMIEAQQERFAVEDEERAIRLKRLEESHQEQLKEIRRAGEERKREQRKQEQQQLDQAKKAFAAQNLALTNFYDEWQRTQFDEQAESLAKWNGFWAEWLRIQGDATSGATGSGTGGTGGTPDGGTVPPDNRPDKAELLQLAYALAIQAGYTPQTAQNLINYLKFWNEERIAKFIEDNFHYDVPGYKMGTPFVPNDGYAYLHKGEAVLDKDTAGAFRRAGILSNQMSASYATTNNRMRMGDINIYQQPGQSGQDVANAVKRELITYFGGL